jgi:hypothetical protein
MENGGSSGEELIAVCLLQQSRQCRPLLAGQAREFEAKMEAIGVTHGAAQLQWRVSWKLQFHDLTQRKSAGDDGSYAASAYGGAPSMQHLSVAANDVDPAVESKTRMAASHRLRRGKH